MTTLLIVDDEEQLVRNIASYLALGPDEFQIVTAFSGEEALAILETRAVDVVLTDVRLPGIDGIQVVRQAIACYPHLRVVVMTAFSSPELRTQAVNEGALRFVEKPLDLEELRLLLEDVTTSRHGWAGRVGGLDIIDLAQLLALSGRSCAVRVAFRNEHGILVFKSGELIHASTRKLEGDKALFTMACWDGGEFEELESGEVRKHRRNIVLTTSHLLAEAARLRADGRDGAAGDGNPPRATVRAAAGRDNGVFASSKGHLTGRLEVWSPFELLQLSSQFRKSGRLEFFRDDGLTAACSSVNGDLVTAECGHLRGREAGMTFLWWNRGWFAFDAQSDLAASDESIRIPELIMDAVRLADEVERRHALLPDRDEPLELVAGARPPEDTLGCGVARLFAFLAANPGSSCTGIEESLPLAPVKIRLGLAQLAEAGKLAARDRKSPAPALPESAPAPWWQRVVARHPGGLRALVAHAPDESQEALFRAVGLLADSLDLPAPAFGLSNDGPSFVRLRPAGGGILSLTFLPVSRKNSYLFESFVQSVDLVLACAGTRAFLGGRDWASVVPSGVRLRTLERSQPLDSEILPVLQRMAEAEECQ